MWTTILIILLIPAVFFYIIVPIAWRIKSTPEQRKKLKAEVRKQCYPRSTHKKKKQYTGLPWMPYV